MKTFELPLDFNPRDDKPVDHCGVVGVFGHPQASQLTYLGMLALQHRGQEGCGIVSCDIAPRGGKTRLRVHKDFGLVSEVFADDKILTRTLVGESAIGHNRYSTAGSSINRHNIQPYAVNYKGGNLALCHNGNLTNHNPIRRKLQNDGTIFLSTSDTEIILHLVARSKETDQVHQIIDALNQVQGAYSILILTDDKLIAARDPHGWRPLAVGKIGEAFVVASETCAFDIINATYLDDVKPGEVLVFDRESLATGESKSYHLRKTNSRPHYCIFEYIYFSRPDSRIFGESVDRVRRKLGKTLAHEHPVSPESPDEKVIVINVPDSSNTATLGFVSENTKLGNVSRFEIGLIRSHYVGRTFIQPDQDVREMAVRTKFNTVRGVLKGRKVVIVDDSIVRGTTSKQLIKLIREAGAKEIHFRVTSPPIKHPCYYGMDFPKPTELIANELHGDIDQIRRELGVDSLGYLSLESLLASVPRDRGESYCTACFSGEYPVPIDQVASKNDHES